MDKYQEALDKIKIMGDKDLYNERHVEWANILQEFIYQNKPLTFDECIKEWEEKGFEIISHTKERFEVYKQWIEKINHCSHHTSAKVVIEKDFFYIVGQFSSEYTQLLIKTLKALEAEDAQNT